VADVIPVFPLSHVLLPGMTLPLHIFEPRYRQLLVDVQSSPGPATFGIIAIVMSDLWVTWLASNSGDVAGQLLAIATAADHAHADIGMMFGLLAIAFSAATRTRRDSTGSFQLALTERSVLLPCRSPCAPPSGTGTLPASGPIGRRLPRGRSSPQPEGPGR